jgi:hypothetical protein
VETWETKARALFPHLGVWQPDDYLSIYTLFTELLVDLRVAHRSSNTDQLEKIYHFAAWCFDQDYEVFNASGVAFYEHLVDDPLTYQAIPRWIEPRIFRVMSQLFEWRLGLDEYKRLEQEYKQANPSYMAE